MIKTKNELKKYLEQDKIALYKKKEKHPKFFGDEIWKWQIIYRKYEYLCNLKQTNFLIRLKKLV